MPIFTKTASQLAVEHEASKSKLQKGFVAKLSTIVNDKRKTAEDLEKAMVDIKKGRDAATKEADAAQELINSTK